MIKVLALLMVFLALPYDAKAGLWRCDVEVKRICNVSACKEVSDPKDFVLINTKNETYSLCERGKSDCQILGLIGGQQSGIFFTFKFGGAGQLKVALMDEPNAGVAKGHFLELRDVLLSNVQSYGSCVLTPN